MSEHRRPHPPATAYRGTAEGHVFVVSVDPEGLVHDHPLPPGLEIVNHSSTGFAWGYSGSGPAQLAFAICLDVLGERDRALRVHQAFKAQVVAHWHWPEAWSIRRDAVEQVLRRLEESG